MIQDPQEYLQQWEKENNPFYPYEMRDLNSSLRKLGFKFVSQYKNEEYD